MKTNTLLEGNDHDIQVIDVLGTKEMILYEVTFINVIGSGKKNICRREKMTLNYYAYLHVRII
jgi:hypothetical protein